MHSDGSLSFDAGTPRYDPTTPPPSWTNYQNDANENEVDDETSSKSSEIFEPGTPRYDQRTPPSSTTTFGGDENQNEVDREANQNEMDYDPLSDAPEIVQILIAHVNQISSDNFLAFINSGYRDFMISEALRLGSILDDLEPKEFTVFLD